MTDYTTRTDLVKRLRWTALHGTQEDAIDIMREAADEIERLTAALKLIAEFKHSDPWEYRGLPIVALCALEPKP